MSPWRPVIAGVDVGVEFEVDPPPQEIIKDIKINNKIIFFIVSPKKTPLYWGVLINIFNYLY